MIDSANGHLMPGDKETPSLVSLGCDKWVLAGDNTYLISVGETTFMVTKFPYVPLGFSDFNPPPNWKFKGIGKYSEVISISKSADGLLVLTLDLRNADGSLMARFDEDGFEVGNGFKGRHPNKSTLIIEDSHGARVLKVAYMNKTYLSIEGSIVVDGKVIVNTFENQHFCLPPNAGLEIMQESPR